MQEAIHPGFFAYGLRLGISLPSAALLKYLDTSYLILHTKSHDSCLFLPVIGECRVKKCRERDVVHGCSNIADLNTGVSLHSSPLLKESARYFVGDFAICSNHFKVSP